MTEYYLLDHWEKFTNLEPAGDDYWQDDLVYGFNNQNRFPPLSEWHPIELKTAVYKRKTAGLADFANVAPIIINQRAIDALGDIIEKHGQLYPVKTVDTDVVYWAYRVTKMVDCLDEERSLGSLRRPLLRSPNVPPVTKFSAITTFVLDHGKIGDEDIFELPNYNGYIFVSERFVERLKAANITGVQFFHEGVADGEDKPIRLG